MAGSKFAFPPPKVLAPSLASLSPINPEAFTVLGFLVMISLYKSAKRIGFLEGSR